MDLARVQGQGDTPEGLIGVEPLGDADRLQHRYAIGNATQFSISVFRPPVLERESAGPLTFERVISRTS
jgi:hypothetical protein